ncbi:NF-kappa-B inhibitor-like protein 1 [Scleropages formosus]|uniref:NF-kappa-B inhibitor-like protein 1 n=1 Tax=Scleropages formosus TaxID=113540 RepID=A0A8C9RWH0_SCLFO|nr:NF-kappa-B inhibitor-like protein 1 [Scleropages formosus]
MVSRKQKRVLRYVEEGSVLKLKSYLRKHHHMEISFSQGRKQRGPLHVACSVGDDAVLRLLLRRGADALQKDHRGDTPLHIAVNQALKYGKTAYDDLVVPLRRSCPSAMDVANKAGVTPRDLLRWMRTEQLSDLQPEGSPEQNDAESQWREKLFGECQDEFCETFGQYDDDFLRDDVDPEDFGHWADRIRQEYYAKQRAQETEGRTYGKKKKKKEEKEESEYDRRQFQAQLEREHAEYQVRAQRRAEEVMLGRRQRYEEKCAAALSDGSDTLLGYSDIPWPAPRGSVEDMVAVMLHGADRSDPSAFRKVLRRQQALWHPDKFAQRCGGRLCDSERQRILDTVTALSQELNRLAQDIR